MGGVIVEMVIIQIQIGISATVKSTRYSNYFYAYVLRKIKY